MAKLTWDGAGQKKYENGISRGVLYRKTGTDTGKEWQGVAWNGLTSISESPEGADPQDFYADNIKYATLRAAETFGGTIEAYTYPEEFEYCNGELSPIKGMVIGQQPREMFRLCYRTEQGNDENANAGYKLHLVYGASCSPSEKSYETVNDNPDIINPSWEFDTTPVAYGDGNTYKPVSLIVVDSTQFTTAAEKAALTALEDALYGTASTEPYMPDPAAVATLLTPRT